MSASVKQYVDLYDASVALIGDRPAERRRLLESGELDDVFAPTDYGVNLRRMALPVDPAKSFGCAIPAVSAVPAAVVNDIFAVTSRLSERMPQGVTLMSLHRAARECPELIPDRVVGYDDAETRLNDLLWTDGVLLNIAPGIHLEKPIQLVNIFASPVDLMAVRRIVVRVGKGSDARMLLCDHTQDSDRRYLSAEMIQIRLDEGSQFGLDILEESTAKTVRRTTVNAQVAKNASLHCTAATLSCGDARIRVSADLEGEGARAEINGMVIADKEQKARYDTRVVHHAEHSSSNQLFKYVADGESHCSFNGRIIVEESARFTEAYQTNKNLLASERAIMHAEPTLEIYCDEVKCSHGAATGRLDENAMFYMRQRGIPKDHARRLLMESFVSDVIDSVHIAGLRDRLRHLAERRFSGLGSDAATCADCSLNQTSTSNVD